MEVRLAEAHAWRLVQGVCLVHFRRRVLGAPRRAGHNVL